MVQYQTLVDMIEATKTDRASLKAITLQVANGSNEMYLSWVPAICMAAGRAFRDYPGASSKCSRCPWALGGHSCREDQHMRHAHWVLLNTDTRPIEEVIKAIKTIKTAIDDSVKIIKEMAE